MTMLEERPVAEPAKPTPEPLPVMSGETVLLRQVRWFVALCSIMAGVIHVLAAYDHIDHHVVLGETFFFVAALQIVWGAVLLAKPSKTLLFAGIALNVLCIGIWVLSRTNGWGISWYPGMDGIDPLGWRDVVEQFFQIPLILGAAMLVLPAKVNEPAEGKPIEATPIAVIALGMMLVLGVLYSATHGYVHTHSHGSVPGAHTAGSHDG